MIKGYFELIAMGCLTIFFFTSCSKNENVDAIPNTLLLSYFKFENVKIGDVSIFQNLESEQKDSFVVTALTSSYGTRRLEMVLSSKDTFAYLYRPVEPQIVNLYINTCERRPEFCGNFYFQYSSSSKQYFSSYSFKWKGNMKIQNQTYSNVLMIRFYIDKAQQKIVDYFYSPNVGLICYTKMDSIYELIK